MQIGASESSSEHQNVIEKQGDYHAAMVAQPTVVPIRVSRQTTFLKLRVRALAFAWASSPNEPEPGRITRSGASHPCTRAARRSRLRSCRLWRHEEDRRERENDPAASHHDSRLDGHHPERADGRKDQMQGMARASRQGPASRRYSERGRRKATPGGPSSGENMQLTHQENGSLTVVCTFHQDGAVAWASVLSPDEPSLT